MLYEVCYRALLSISVVEATNGRVAREACLCTRARAAARAGSRAAHRARSSIFRFQPQDSLAGGPPARWFVITARCSLYSLFSWERSGEGAETKQRI